MGLLNNSAAGSVAPQAWQQSHFLTFSYYLTTDLTRTQPLLSSPFSINSPFPLFFILLFYLLCTFFFFFFFTHLGFYINNPSVLTKSFLCSRFF